MRVPTGERAAVGPDGSGPGDESDPEKTETRLPAPSGPAASDDETPESRPTVDLAGRLDKPRSDENDEDSDPEKTAVIDAPRTVDLSARRRR